MKKIIGYTILLVVILGAIFLRLYRLNTIPPGLLADEASQGFNAFSLLKTGKDMYGHIFPILFRANGSYQPPLYTYLSIVPVYVFGNTPFAIRFVSALSGTLLIVLTFLIINIFGIGNKKQKFCSALIISTLLAITPWAFHFSRLADEANLGVFIFMLSIFLFSISLKKSSFFPVAAFFLGLATHAYYSERIIALLFLPVFLIVFRKDFRKKKNLVIVGLLLFVLTQIPHLLILTTGAYTQRFTEVSYFSVNLLESVGGIFITLIKIGQQFAGHYFSYFSPNNLFFYSGNILGSPSPSLSVFYGWLFIPFLFGLAFLFKKRKETLCKIIIILMILTPIPASLTGDPFYPLRTLDFLWVITIIIGLGLVEIWNLIKINFVRIFLFLGFLGYSLVCLYISYFIFLRIEQGQNFGYAYVKLDDKIIQYSEKNFLVDFNSRAWGEGIRMAYLMKADPILTQKNLSSQLTTPYYSGNVNANEVFVVGNTIIKPLSWGSACGNNLVIVGDEYSISPKQAKDHSLSLFFKIDDPDGTPDLFAYSAPGCIKK